MESDSQYMRRALELARIAEAQGEVPIGAVIIGADNEIVAEATNGPIGLNDPTAHAEVLALRQAGTALGNYRLPECTLYVTLEPCAMCAAAIVHARLKRLVYAASDSKAGACGGAIDLINSPVMNHRVTIDSGLCADASAALLKAFFRRRRPSRNR